jgi:hypothetical protein
LDLARGSDSLRGSATSAADQNFLNEDLEVSCVAKYCSKLYQLQVCSEDPSICDNYDNYDVSDYWRDVTDNEVQYCDTYERNYNYDDFEVLPLVTCKTTWGSAPNGDRYFHDCHTWSNRKGMGDFRKFRYIEIPGSLKNKEENKCSKRCTYEGPNLNLVPLWGCCDGKSDSALAC